MKNSNSFVLHHLYGLLIEINFHRSEVEMFSDESYKEDPFIQKHLRQIKLSSAKYKAEANKSRYAEALIEIKRLKSIGFDEIKKLLAPSEAMQLQPLFRKFEELSENDEASILEDQELLRLIEG